VHFAFSDLNKTIFARYNFGPKRADRAIGQTGPARSRVEPSSIIGPDLARNRAGLGIEPEIIEPGLG